MHSPPGSPTPHGVGVGTPPRPAAIQWDDTGRALLGLTATAGLSIFNWLLWWLDADLDAVGMFVSLGQIGFCIWLATLMFRDGPKMAQPTARSLAPLAALAAGARATLPVIFHVLGMAAAPPLIWMAANWLSKLVLLVFFVSCYAALIAQSKWRTQWAMHIALLALLLVLLLLPTLTRLVFPIQEGFLSSMILRGAWIVLDVALLGAWYLSRTAPITQPATGAGVANMPHPHGPYPPRH